MNSLASFIGQLSVNMYNILSHVYVYLTIAIGVCWFVEYLVSADSLLVLDLLRSRAPAEVEGLPR